MFPFIFANDKKYFLLKYFANYSTYGNTRRKLRYIKPVCGALWRHFVIGF